MLITIKSTDSYTQREAGGKAYNLYLLSREGFPVPRWAALGASAFTDFLETNSLDGSISKELSHVKSKSNLNQISKRITKLILDAPLPPDTRRIARQAFQYLNTSAIAVRSSALDEDSSKHSFAGQLSTKLFVKSEAESLNALKECWASAFSERSLSYRIQNKLSLDVKNIRVAVIFQEMVEAEKSGVLFTCDPIQQDASKITINSVYGLGEGFVSDLLDADTFILDKESGKKLQEVIAHKKTQLIRGASGVGTVTAPVKKGLRDLPALSGKELQKLLEMARAVEEYYKFPQDIEWAQNGGKLYLLQSRPVTSPVINNNGFLNIWDNSNISESYSGITLPLTFGFAHYVYHQVYVQFCEILLVPPREIRNMDFFLKNMLGLFYGRVYYNLLNWYKLTSILPGFKYNRSFMETMMGTNKELEDEIADRIKPPGFQESLASKVRRAVTGFKFGYYHFTIQYQVNKFMRHFYDAYEKYRKLDYQRMPADEILQNYQKLERELLREWKAPIINDFLCMVHFGLLKKLTGQWLAQSGGSLQNDLLCGEANIESTEPTRELIRMVAIVGSTSNLKELLESTSSEDCLEALNQSEFHGFKKKIDNYIEKYGFRCMNEMKLEQKDLYQDPAFLFVCIKNYLRSGHIDFKKYEEREYTTRHTAEKVARKNLSPLKRIIYFWSLKHARKAVRNRENTRFCRTRIYGVVRAMFYGIGEDYTRRQIIDLPEDIFYLELNELMGSLEGTLTVQNLRVLIGARKEEYEKYERFEPANRFITRGPVYWMNEHSARESTAEPVELRINSLRGIGCSPGIIEGRVKVVLSRSDDMTLNGEILVAKQTDPGWIPLYPSASGLLVERGGLLSHSAIVAREMGLPTIVSVQGLTERLRTGMRVRFDGKTGVIEILDS